MDRKKTVVVGMSGGVDSSVAAYLLKKEGYQVIGVTMQFWKDRKQSDDAGEFSGSGVAEDAERVAQKLDIPYYVMDFQQEFQKHVINYFIREYQAGRTPNPCIACNRYVKWEALLQRSQEMGADYVATGHYARICHLESGRYAVENAASAGKDQSYALYQLTQEQLARTLMPIGNYDKARVRQIAEELDLPVAHKADSMDICFVPDGDYASFIEEMTGVKSEPGNFVDTEGNVIGEHRGVIHYTVGQRKGLNLALGHPVFVTRINPERNEIVVGGIEENLSRKVSMNGVNFMAEPEFSETKTYLGKIRYNHKGAPCTVRRVEEGRYECTFAEAQRGVTPGQALVLYDGSFVAGGGTIL